MRTLISEPPFIERDSHVSWIERGFWPAYWISCEGAVVPYVCAFRLRFELPAARTVRLHVTADERYELFLDGARLGMGPERGDRDNWFFETFDLDLAAGEHLISVLNWALGDFGPRSQMSLAPGLLVAPDDEALLPLLATGVADWEAQALPGCSFQPPRAPGAYSVAQGTTQDGTGYPWGWITGDDASTAWNPAIRALAGATTGVRNRYSAKVHMLKPATLPAQRETFRPLGLARHVDVAGPDDLDSPRAVTAAACLTDELDAWTQLLQGQGPLTIPAETQRRVIVDLRDYVCAYPEAELSGGRGSQLRIHWAESLYEQPAPGPKGHRGAIEGKFVIGYGDVFIGDGGQDRAFSGLHLRSGRYLEIEVNTASDPLVIRALHLRESGYPLPCECEFTASDRRLEDIFKAGLLTLRASSQDAFTDGPYYEQIMWSGDGVQNMSTCFALTLDDRLTRKMLRLFHSSLMPSGFTAARWPARDVAILPPYCLLWVSMIRRYAWWRDDPALVRGLLPGVRTVLDATLGHLNDDGLLQVNTGWNFVDWVPGWPHGMPPGADLGVSAVLNWQLVRTLNEAAELEDAFGEPECAARWRRRASELAQRLIPAFWVEDRGLFADDLARAHFSEHAQCEALLSGALNPSRTERIVAALFSDPDLARATIAYSFYLFEVCQATGRADVLLERLQVWYDAFATGLLTTPESPEPSRSDCHAWGAHPIFHYFATVLGIRPAAPGFKAVRITPNLGPLTWAKGRLPHPLGEIEVELEQDGAHLVCGITLPEGLSGELLAHGKLLSLRPGRQQYVIEA